jgi:hypothetical protein
VALGEHFAVIQAAGIRRDQRDAEQKPEIADAIHQEGFQIRINRGRPRVPEADQQIGHQTDGFPAEKELEKIVAHHQHQHREGE